MKRRKNIKIDERMNEDNPTWALVAHVGIIGHDRVLVSQIWNVPWRTYTTKPVLFEFPTYEYLKTGNVFRKCLSFKEKLGE